MDVARNVEAVANFMVTNRVRVREERREICEDGY